ncbi:retrovirus-related pol polyprotein from transposon TNT 1-94 [Tanacetum coccineum]
MDSMIPNGKKNTLGEYMILSGTDNRPPMLDKPLYDFWKSRMEIYMQNREHGRMIIESVEHGPLGWPSIEVDGVTRLKKYAELSASEKLQADFQWRQSSFAAGTFGTRANISGTCGNNSGQPRVVKCFNCQREGHMARQCPKPKRKRDATWFRDKVLLVKAQESGKVLNEEELEFLTDSRVVEGPVSQIVITHNTTYQADDLDAYDSDCDDFSTAKAVLMANFSSYGSNVLSEKNAQFADFKKEINYLKQTLSKQSKEKELLTKTFNVFKNESKEKEAKNIDKEITLEKKVKELDNIVCKMGQSAPMLYDDSVIAKETNVILIADSEETLMLKEESRSKMILKQSDLMVLEKKVNIKPINYAELIQLSKYFGNRFIPQQELYDEQAFRLKTSHPNTDQSASSPVQIEAPRELSKINPDTLTDRGMGFEQPKMEAVVQQYFVDKQCFEIQKKQFLIENDRLLDQIISQDIVNIVVNSLMDINTFVNVNSSAAMNDSVNYVEMCNKCLELEAELIKQHNMVEKDEYNRLSKSFSKLEQHCISLELAMQLNKEIFQKNDTSVNQTEPTFDHLFKLNNLKAELQGKDTTIEKFKANIKCLNKPSTINRKGFCHNNIKNNLRKFKGKDIVDNATQVSNATTIAPAAILREIVEQAKSLNPLDSASYFACKYVKLIQELLGYVRDTCPDIHKPSEKLVVVTPNNKKKIVSYMFDARHELCFLEFVSDMNVSSKSKSVKKAKKKEEWKPTGKVVQIVLWYLDSGCSKHMTGDRSQLTNFVHKFLGTVKFGDDQIAKIMGYGDYQIGNITILRVYYVEGLGHNLFFVGQFCNSDLEVAFRKHTCFVRNLEGVDLILGSRETNLYTLSIRDMMASSPICLLSKASKTKSWLWHRQLSHLNFGAINHLAKNGLEKLYLLRMDLCGPIRVASINRKKYILVIVDDYSRFIWVKFLASKGEAPDFIIKFLKIIQVRLNAPVRDIRTDNRTEFVNQTLRSYYESVGISHETSVARSP